MSTFGFDSTADEVLEGRDLTGRTVLVTGGYSGLGRETARAMAAKGAHVILSGRDATKLAAAADDIAEATGAKVDTLVCDLASLDSIRKATDEANARFDKIDLLINNAGVMACPMGRTADGFETQFGTNHLGHFLFTNRLVPLLEEGEQPRVVTLSSLAHHRDKVHFDDPNYSGRDYDKWEAYGQSKTANVLFTVGLEHRLAPRGIHAYAVHPGGIMTNLGRHMSEEDVAAMRKTFIERARKAGEEPRGFKTIPQGAATTCWAATAEEISGTGGVYCEDCHVAERDDANPLGRVRGYALDPDAAERLWTLSEELVGERFAY